MRDIDFRFYDTFLKKIFVVDDMNSYEVWECICDDRFESMQYTGLKDKNGVKTYRKDIVKYMENVADGHFVEAIVVVDLDFTGVNFNYAAEFEVIGNIHKSPELNPELIKQ